MTQNTNINMLAGVGTECKDFDIHAMSLNAARKQLAIPKLDENQLNLKRLENASGGGGGGGGGATFSVAEGTLPTAEGLSVPLNSNAPAFVIPLRSPYVNGAIGLDSPTANAACLALLQQQSLQYQMQQAYTPEQELYMTHSVLQQCPRSILLMVLSSLVEENPQLSGIIRQRCEKAALLLAQQQQQAATAGRFAEHMGGGPWVAHNAPSSSYESPRASVFANSGSPHTGSNRKGRGVKNREEGLCSVHNSMRSMNHLQVNKHTGLYECVHGFHCLEDGGSTAKTLSHLQSPGSPNRANAHGNNLTPKPANSPAPQSRPTKDLPGGINADGNACTESSYSNSGGIKPPQEGSCDQASAKEGVPLKFGAELDVLKNILQSVREMEKKGS